LGGREISIYKEDTIYFVERYELSGGRLLGDSFIFLDSGTSLSEPLGLGILAVALTPSLEYMALQQ
jgi:hypothetical protein